MSDALKIKVYQTATVSQYVGAREGETHVGQVVKFLTLNTAPNTLVKASHFATSLKEAYSAGARYAVVTIPEDIGPRANVGRGGAEKGPQAFLKFFLPMQSNRYFDYSKVVMIGEIDADDLMRKASGEKDVEKLRELCAKLDEYIAPVIKEIVLAGLEPIVVGGGNNNSLPVIQGVCEAVRTVESKEGLSVVNCDPHADFRRLEGRHSGNPFSYANDRGYLKRYCVFGLHENYNNQDMLERLEKSGFKTFSYEDFAIRRSIAYQVSLEQMTSYLKGGGHPIGCELDVDGIKNMPASARTAFGLTEEQAAEFVHAVASQVDSYYLHLSEGAPEWGSDEGEKVVGKCLALMVVTYLKAREQYRKQHGAKVGMAAKLAKTGSAAR